MADIPGLIEGASEGAGLGTQFLRHLARCRVLLHLVDCAPLDGTDPFSNLQTVEAELLAYSEALAERPCWIALSKIDLLEEGARKRAVEALRRRVGRRRRVFGISAADGTGIAALVRELMKFVEKTNASLASDADAAERERERAERIAADVLRHSLVRRPVKVVADTPDDGGVEVVYRRD